MNLPKCIITMKSFITSQFAYCPLIWMFRSRTLNNKFNSIQERALGINYNDRNLYFQKIIKKDNTVSIHHRNLHVLATEILKNKAPKISTKFSRPGQYHTSFHVRQVQSVHHSTESLSFLGPKM